MKLTEEQELVITQFVDDHKLKIQSLRDDIVDHLCCVVEVRVKGGEDFNEAFQEAIQELAPNGLQDIEKQTIFLLNYKRIIMMKKVMYLIGFVGAFILTIGVTFKILHYPYANNLSTIGFLVLLLGYAPLLVIDKYKLAIAGSLSEKLKIITGGLAAIMVSMSILFKIFHLQGASILLLAGAFIFAVGFLPFLFFTMYKKSVS